MPPETKVPASTNSQLPVNKNRAHVLVGILALIIILAGAWMWVSKGNINITETQQVQNQTQNVDLSETKDWLTYTNTEYGFEFKYPKELFLTASHYFTEWGNQGHIVSVSECPRQGMGCGAKKTENIMMAFVRVVPKIEKEPYAVPQPIGLSAENEKYNFIFHDGDDVPSELVKKAHSTFMSIPIQDEVNEELVTYKNESLGFEFQYPAYFGQFEPAPMNTEGRHLVADNFPLPSKRATLGIGITPLADPYYKSIRDQFRLNNNVQSGVKVFEDYGAGTSFDYVDTYQFFTFEDSKKVFLEKQYANGNLYVCDSTGEGTSDGWGVHSACVIYNQKYDYLLKIDMPVSDGAFLPRSMKWGDVLGKIISSLEFTK